MILFEVALWLFWFVLILELNPYFYVTQARNYYTTFSYGEVNLFWKNVINEKSDANGNSSGNSIIW